MDDGVIFATGLAFLQAAGHGEGHVQPKSRNISKKTRSFDTPPYLPRALSTKGIGSSTVPLPAHRHCLNLPNFHVPFVICSSFGRALYNSCILGIDLSKQDLLYQQQLLIFVTIDVRETSNRRLSDTVPRMSTSDTTPGSQFDDHSGVALASWLWGWILIQSNPLHVGTSPHSSQRAFRSSRSTNVSNDGAAMLCKLALNAISH